MRKGRFSKQEIQYIKDNCEQKDSAVIAGVLERDPESVEKFIKERLGKNLETKDEEALHVSYDLLKRPFWKDIKEQFNDNELEMFLYHWGRLITQFKDDVLPTEELQVIDAIKLELLMNRSLREQQATMRNIGALESELVYEKEKDITNQNSDRIFNLEKQVAFARAAQESLNRDYKDLQDKKNRMLRELKGTREQRIKELEDGKQTFIGWLKSIIRNPAYRKELGIRMEKMRLATDAEERRLSEYHTYEDGNIDQPFLTPDTVKEDNN